LNANRNQPIVILGFGRSGTTWLSDIISKSLGGLILFEPLHPEVFEQSYDCLYHNGKDDLISKAILSQFDKVLNLNVRNKWLLRNHLSTSLEEASEKFVQSVWDNTQVIGLKSIRANLFIDQIYSQYSRQIVFVKRDPLAVAASLLRRIRFWEEYGFEKHINKFFKEAIFSDQFKFLNKESLHIIFNQIKEDYLKMMFIWGVTHLIVERQLKSLSIPLFRYENFYLDPFKSTYELMEYLDRDKVNIHPSYIFTPSMLTLKTSHEFSNNSISDDIKLSFFWNDMLTSIQIQEIEALISKIWSSVED